MPWVHPKQEMLLHNSQCKIIHRNSSICLHPVHQDRNHNPVNLEALFHNNQLMLQLSNNQVSVIDHKINHRVLHNNNQDLKVIPNVVIQGIHHQVVIIQV